MDPIKAKIVSLFGDDHYSSDEELLQHQQGLKRRLYDAFGSDSEPEESSDMLNLEYTDISDDEEKTDTVNKMTLSSMDSTEEIVTQTIGRIQVFERRPKTVDQAKALAQYRRQVAAKITKYQTQADIRIPESIMITNSSGQPVQLNETDIIKDEKEVIQQADRAILGKSIVDATLDVMHNQHRIQGDTLYQDLISKNTEQSELVKSTERSTTTGIPQYKTVYTKPVQPIQQVNDTLSTTSTISTHSVTRISRKERKRNWYKKKTSQQN